MRNICNYRTFCDSDCKNTCNTCDGIIQTGINDYNIRFKSDIQRCYYCSVTSERAGCNLICSTCHEYADDLARTV